MRKENRNYFKLGKNRSIFENTYKEKCLKV